MADKQLSDIAEKMKGIDIAFLTTRTKDGELAGRPMSNNGDVEYDGDSYYFTFEEAETVSDIERDPKVGLGFSGEDGFYVAVEGRAELIRDKQAFREHWTPDLDKWFEQGADTPNVVMVKVHAERVKYWNRNEGGEVRV